MGNVKQDSSENNLPKGHPPQITPQGIPDPRSKSEKNNKPKEKGSYKRGDYIAKVAPTSANDDEKLQIARICEGFRGFSSIATMILQVYLRSTYAQVAVQPKSKSETSKPKPPGGIVSRLTRFKPMPNGPRILSNLCASTGMRKNVLNLIS